MRLKTKRRFTLLLIIVLFAIGTILVGFVSISDTIIKCNENWERFTVLFVFEFVYIILFISIVANPIANAFSKNVYKSSPEFTVPVKVVSKLSSASGGRFSTNTFLVSFELPDGSRKNFNMDMAHYNLISENVEGILKYREQGNHLFFVDFQINKNC